MVLSGKDQTEEELKRFKKVIAKQYKVAIDEMTKELKELHTTFLTGKLTDAERKIILKQGARLNKLVLRVQDLYVEAAIKAGELTAEAARLAVTNNFYRQRFSLAFASDAINPFRLDFLLIDPNVVEFSVLGSRDVWRKIAEDKKQEIRDVYGGLSKYRPKYGTLTQVLLENRGEDLVKIRNTITQGLIQGKSYKTSAKALQKIMDNSFSNSMRIMRTEGNRNMNAGHFAASESAKNEGVELRRQILATLDDRTREQSAKVDTQFENKEGFFIYPDGLKVVFPGNSGVAAYDINDRETVVERLKGFPPKKRIGRDPTTGENEIMDFQNFDQWAKSNGLKYNKAGRLGPK